jgi:hypothetical protein
MVRSGTPSVTMLPVTIPVYIFPRGGTEARPRGLTGPAYGEKWDSLRHDVAGHNSGIHLPERRHRSTASRFDGWEPDEPPRGMP